LTEEFKEEKASLFTLIQSGEDNNVDIAIQIMEGNPLLHNAFVQEAHTIIEKSWNTRAIHGVLRVLVELPEANQNLRKRYVSILGLVAKVGKEQPLNGLVSVLRNFNSAYVYNNKKWKPDLVDIEILKTIPLKKLSLQEAGLTQIPKWIGFLRQLEYLDLCENVFKKLPDSICKLINLKQLNLKSNKLEELPRNIGQLKNSKQLNYRKIIYVRCPILLDN